MNRVSISDTIRVLRKWAVEIYTGLLGQIITANHYWTEHFCRLHN